jgi:hypothetical protein
MIRQSRRRDTGRDLAATSSSGQTAGHSIYVSFEAVQVAAGGSRLQLMWRWRSSVLDGPGSVEAIQGPGIDGSMMPSSSQE